jgi:hypothetical protein
LGHVFILNILINLFPETDQANLLTTVSPNIDNAPTYGEYGRSTSAFCAREMKLDASASA